VTVSRFSRAGLPKTGLPSGGLYAIADSTLHSGAALEQAVSRAIAGGARIIQYRDKSEDADRRRAEATMLVRICRRHSVPMIVNDDVELALLCDADGVHVGRNDTDLLAARSRLGSSAIIGVSCYNRIELAKAAQRNGADYVAFGSMFSSTTKPDATRCEIATVESARGCIHLPIVAIGGITPQNGGILLDAGVDLLAVVRGVFGHDAPGAAARRYAQLFSRQAQDEES
jgi:thiamine-phosphate pyrophosphorylase